MTNQKIEEVIDIVVHEIYLAYPDLLTKYGEAGRKKCREDNGHHFNNLDVAYKLNNPQVFFVDYATWLNNLLTSRAMKTEHIIDNFERINQAIQDIGLGKEDHFYQECLTKAISLLNKGSFLKL